MDTSEAINELATALAKAQAVMKHAEKDRINPHFKNRYATLASVWDAARAALTSNGLSVVQATGGDGAAITVSTLLLHTSGQWIRSSLAMSVAALGPQAIGSLCSYLRRYSFASMVGVCADEDDDANSSTPKVPHAQAPSNPPKANPPGDAKAAAQPPVPAEPRPLTDAQRWNVAVATIRRKLGAVGDKMIAEITARFTPTGETKVPDDKRPALIAELEKTAGSDAKKEA